jgi:flagellar biosynthesis protein FlhB
MSDDRTEKPTAKRLREAREKGQLPRSRDLGSAASLLAAIMTLSWLGGSMHTTLTTVIEQSLRRMGDNPAAGLGAGEVVNIATQVMLALAAVVGPLAFAAITAIIAAQTAQGGFVFASEALGFDLSKLSPATGIKRLGPSQGGMALLKAFIATTVIAFFAWKAVKAGLNDSIGLTRLGALAAAKEGWTGALTLFRQAAIAMFVMACLDYGVQRWQFMRGQRMTKQEIKDEHKLQEGSPEVKGRVRRIQRDLVRRRMRAAVKQATVVVVNPTHYAVALEYNRAVMAAPRVVAKGRGFVALRIKEMAREFSVPIVENPPLARALHKHAEVGDVIPAALFEAVAEVLAYLIKLRQLVL